MKVHENIGYQALSSERQLHTECSKAKKQLHSECSGPPALFVLVCIAVIPSRVFAFFGGQTYQCMVLQQLFATFVNVISRSLLSSYLHADDYDYAQ